MYSGLIFWKVACAVLTKSGKEAIKEAIMVAYQVKSTVFPNNLYIKDPIIPCFPKMTRSIYPVTVGANTMGSIIISSTTCFNLNSFLARK